MAANYQDAIGRQDFVVLEAQNQLVNTTVHLALQELYSYAKAKGVLKELENPAIKLDPRHDDNASVSLYYNNGPCKDATETMQALLALQSQYAKVLAFNQLAQRVGFDLSLKTTGAKKPESIIAKSIRKDEEVDDIARITAVSSNLTTLETFAKKLSKEIDEHNNRLGSVIKKDPNKNPDKGWKVTARGHLQRAIYKGVNGIGTELMFLPHDQADTAARITHKYFEITRNWDEYEKEPTEQKRAHMVDEYNKIAEMLNKLTAKKEPSDAYFNRANEVLKSSDSSRFTFDRESEGGKVEAGSAPPVQAQDEGHQPYSQIFKSKAALLSYSHFIKEMQQKSGGSQDQPLEILSYNMENDEIKHAMARLRYFTQVTHACYMRNAPEEWRSLWVKCAVKVNRKNHEETIPAALIDSVAKGIDDVHIDMKQIDVMIKADIKKEHQRGR